jgi:hypothetical protein
VPDYPVSHNQAKLIGNNFYMCSVVVTYGYIKRAVWLQDFFADTHPLFCPGDIVFLFHLVVVFVIFITDIKGWVGENQVRERLVNLAQHLYTIATYYFVLKILHSDMLQPGDEFASGIEISLIID